MPAIVAMWLCWFGAASVYAAYAAAKQPPLRPLGALVLATSSLLVFYLPVRECWSYPASQYDEGIFPDLRPFFEFLWVVAVVGPMHLYWLLMLVGRHSRERGQDRREANAGKKDVNAHISI